MISDRASAEVRAPLVQLSRSYENARPRKRPLGLMCAGRRSRDVAAWSFAEASRVGQGGIVDRGDFGAFEGDRFGAAGEHAFVSLSMRRRPPCDGLPQPAGGFALPSLSGAVGHQAPPMRAHSIPHAARRRRDRAPAASRRRRRDHGTHRATRPVPCGRSRSCRATIAVLRRRCSRPPSHPRCGAHPAPTNRPSTA